MSDQIEIRLANPDEYAVVGDITLLGYQHDGHLEGDDDYAGELTDAASRASGAELWVAVRGDEVLGSVTFCPPGSPFRELSQEGEGEFRMLAITPNARRLGVARALVGRCFERCRELGLPGLVLCSMTTMAPAHALYRSMGFTRDESLDWEPVPGLTLWGFRATV